MKLSFAPDVAPSLTRLPARVAETIRQEEYRYSSARIVDTNSAVR
jgi:hypothetical protein